MVVAGSKTTLRQFELGRFGFGVRCHIKHKGEFRSTFRIFLFSFESPLGVKARVGPKNLDRHAPQTSMPRGTPNSFQSFAQKGDAGIAQLVEQRIRNESPYGLIPHG